MAISLSKRLMIAFLLRRSLSGSSGIFVILDFNKAYFPLTNTGMDMLKKLSTVLKQKDTPPPRNRCSLNV